MRWNRGGARLQCVGLHRAGMRPDEVVYVIAFFQGIDRVKTTL